MVDIVVGPIRAYIRGNIFPDVIEELAHLLSYEYKDAFYMSPYHPSDWDGRRHLLRKKDLSFRTGLLPRVLKFLHERDIETDLTSYVPDYPIETNEFLWNPRIQLREYQERAVTALLKNRRGVLWAVPRSGKTVIAANVIYRLGWVPVLLLCESLDIAYQSQRLLEECLNLPIGLIGDGQVNIKEITIATIQSCISAYNIKTTEQFSRVEKKIQEKEPVRNFVESAKLVFGDEVHHWAARSYQRVSARFLKAGRIYGLSGTPWRNDNSDLLMEQVVGRIVHHISYQELIKAGYLVPPVICFQHVSPQRMKGGSSYSTIYKKYIVENEERNRIICNFADRAAGQGMSTLILVSKIRHGKILAGMLKCKSLFGNSPSWHRNSVFEDLRKKRISTLVTTLADEGLDIPSLDCEVIASGGKSSIQALQRMRAMTPYPGKEECYILDFYDNARFLSQHSKVRLNTYRSYKFNVIEQPPNTGKGN